MWLAVIFLVLSSGLYYVMNLFLSPLSGGTGTDYSSLRTRLLLDDPQAPLKVLLIVEPTPFGYTSGYSNRFKEMLQHIKDCGDDVHILTPDDSGNPPTEYMGYPITTLGGYRLAFYDHVMLSVDFEGKIEKLIKEFQPDVVHVSTPGTVFFPTIYYAKKYGIPLVMSYHTHLPLYAKIYLPVPGSVALANFLLSTFLPFADLTLVTSPQLKEQVLELGANRVAIWQKGINTETFSPQYRSHDVRTKLTEGDDNKTLLLYVGRLGAEKNLKILKEALTSIPNTRLILVGGGPYESELKGYFKGMDVIFTGSKEGRELSEIFASCDIFVMPSETETLGFVVLEAMASGLPVVAIGANGILDIIQHGSTGLLAYPSNHTVKDFTDHIHHLITDPILRHNISQQSRQWAEQWNWKAATVKLRTNQYRAAISLHDLKRSSNKPSDSIPFLSMNTLLNQFFLINSSNSPEEQQIKEQETKILKHFSV